METRTVESCNSLCECIASVFLHWISARFIIAHLDAEIENYEGNCSSCGGDITPSGGYVLKSARLQNSYK